MNIFKLSQKRSGLSAKEDEFSSDYNTIQNLEDTTKMLCKDGKKLSDATCAQGRAACKIGHDLNLTVANYEEDCFMLQEFVKVTDKLNELSQMQGSVLQKTFVEPMRKYNNSFTYVSTQVKSRDKLHQEYVKLQNKLDKLKDKENTGSNLVKKQNLRKEIAPIEKEFNSKNNLLSSNLPAFYNCRLQYLHPIFEALVTSECHHQQMVHKTLDDYLGSILCENESEDKLTSDIANTLEEIRALSITSDEK